MILAKEIMKRIRRTGIVPVVVLGDVEKAVGTARAMLGGGVDLAEVTLRTPAGMEAIRRIAAECPETLVGAGTVLSIEQCREAVEAGARFIVSPGYDEEIVSECIDRGIPVLPGCVTPTEITAARKRGLRVLKFFPANVYGGIGALRSLAAPFRDVQFIPTGGVGPGNLAEYVHPAVYAVGGSWMCPQKDIDAGNFAAITALCRQAADLLREARCKAV